MVCVRLTGLTWANRNGTLVQNFVLRKGLPVRGGEFPPSLPQCFFKESSKTSSMIFFARIRLKLRKGPCPSQHCSGEQRNINPVFGWPFVCLERRGGHAAWLSVQKSQRANSGWRRLGESTYSSLLHKAGPTLDLEQVF